MPLSVSFLSDNKLNFDVHSSFCCNIAADFGFAGFLPGEMMAATLCGSPMYMVSTLLCQLKFDLPTFIIDIFLYCPTSEMPKY